MKAYRIIQVLEYVKRQKDNQDHDRTAAIQTLEEILYWNRNPEDLVLVTYYYKEQFIPENRDDH